jgi:hypothetical protein
MVENAQQLEYCIHQPPLNVFILEDLQGEIEFLTKKETEQISTTAGNLKRIK